MTCFRESSSARGTRARWLRGAVHWSVMGMLLAADRAGAEAAPRLAPPRQLTVEYLREPMGIDVPHPRLSWKLDAAAPEARDLVQSGFQVLVASSREQLARNDGDLWDSSRIDSGQSVNVRYAGRPPRTSQRLHWKVRVWDAAGEASGWSEPATWIAGVMDPAEWKASWIAAHESTRPAFDAAGAGWIWAANAADLASGPAGRTWLQREFEIAALPKGKPAILAVAGDDTYEVFINGELATKTWGHLNSPRQMRFIDVAKHLREGRNQLAAVVVNEAVGPTGLLLTLRLPDGTAIPSDGRWLAAAGEPPPEWKTSAGLLGAGPWREATVAAAIDSGPWGRIERRVETASPAFAKSFRIERPVREATLPITGLGFYEASLTGDRIGRKVLDPPPTRYDRRVLYSTYDVTPHLRQGDNRLSVLLGHGWYDVRSVAVWNFDVAPWRDAPRMLAQLEAIHDDGSRTLVTSDGSWRQVASPIGYDCIREGEVIGMAPEGGPDGASDPLPVAVVPGPAGRLAAAKLPPSVVAEELPPATIRQVRPGTWTVDFGRNVAGWARLRLTGQRPGDVVTIRYGERVADDGSVDQRPIDEHYRHPQSFLVLPGGWFQTDRYVCQGGVETYEPRFTYHGFQYAEVSGLAAPPTPDSIRACVIHNDFPVAGSFSCSSDLLNRIHAAVRTAYLGNFVNGVPTDCPHREKNGWTGDASLASEMAMYEFDNVAGYAKWIDDLLDEQRPDGSLAAIVPTSGWGYSWGNGPAWDSALVIIPWMLYCYAGDEETLRRAYPAMRRYVDSMTARAEDGIVSHGLGDWIPVKTITPAAVTSTGYYHVDALIVARAAEVLGHAADAARYAALADTVRLGFQRRFLAADGSISVGGQTAQSCGLHQGLVPASTRGLVDAVEGADRHFDVGILGSKYLLRSLSEAGRTDLAISILHQRDEPSFGSWLDRGATAFWEDWSEGTSRNHVMFGDVSAWCYQYLAGIRLADSVSAIGERTDPAAVGMRSFTIAPVFATGIDWVAATHESPYGTIRSSWRRDADGGDVVLEVTVPVNAVAVVRLPSAQPAPGGISRRIGSGTHRFTVPADSPRR